MTEKVKRLPINTAGNDYIIGDIHGCYEQFQQLLLEIGFDKSKDRMIACGDLVDRGKDSFKCALLVREPWFHSVMGNHEDMFLQYQRREIDIGMYTYNGGEWATRLDEQSGIILYELLKELPLVIEIESTQGLLGVIHADLFGSYWNEAISELGPEFAMWSRNRIRQMNQSKINGIEKVFFGHTPVNQPLLLGNCHYIDTGCVFGKSLTCYDVTHDIYHSVPYLIGATE